MITHYLVENDTGEVSLSILWDAFKAVFIGSCIVELAKPQCF